MIIRRSVDFFGRINYLLFIIGSVLICATLNLLLKQILPDYVLVIPDILMKISHSWIGMVLIVVIGPIFETLLFQMIPISSIRAMISKETNAFIVSTLVSSIAFALTHGIYGKYYILYAFVCGVVLAMSYNLSIYRKESPFLSVFIIHALWNLLFLLLLKAGMLPHFIIFSSWIVFMCLLGNFDNSRL